ncbi:MAG: HTH-type transcriptional repressor SmtB [Verrucomicrobiota bacterium]|jgi:DNA-binding transcriptional ArsR family regulator
MPGNLEAIPQENLEHCAAALKVLAHPVRLRLVEQLLAGRWSVTQLAAAVSKPQAEISQHLGKMRAAGLLKAEREGKEVYYGCLDPACATIIQCIRKHCP